MNEEQFYVEVMAQLEQEQERDLDYEAWLDTYYPPGE